MPLTLTPGFLRLLHSSGVQHTILRHGLREMRVAAGFDDHAMLPLADLSCAGPRPRPFTTSTKRPSRPSRRPLKAGSQAAAAASAGDARGGNALAPHDAASEGLYHLWCAEAGCSRAAVASVIQRIERLDFSRSFHRIKGTFRPRQGLRSHGVVSLPPVHREEAAGEVEPQRHRRPRGRAVASARHGRRHRSGIDRR